MTVAAQFLLALGCYAGAAITAVMRRTSADVAGAVLSVAGSLLGLSAASAALVSETPFVLLQWPWSIPGGSLAMSMDALSGAFLLVIFAVAGFGSIYGLAYWGRTEHVKTATRLRFFYAVMTIAIAVVFTARNSVLFLVAWEIMALSAFLLVATEDESAEVRHASWIYLVATHIGTIGLFLAFALLRRETGSFTLMTGLAASHRLSLIFLLALFGFGFKAGLVPLHFWLPGAHANAPSHVSALMSGVMLKAGIYGILRISSLVAVPPLWWSFLLAFIAAVTAVTGIALAFTQTDLKKALAYSSIENMGIICLGISLALAGKSQAQPAWIALGLAGAIIHVWSHGAFKSLLFFASGGVLHSTHSRSMERMGGLLRRMPVTGSTFVIGALSAAGLPLFNGFIGEWLIALGFFHAICSNTVTGGFLAFAATALALAGALALASMVRIVGVVFLGTPRTPEATEARESSMLMQIPMVCLAILCFAIGLWPALLSRPLIPLVASWAPQAAMMIPALLSLPYAAYAALTFVLLLLGAILRWMMRRRPVRTAVTWDCGYAQPTARMQYTAGSAGEWFTGRLLPASLQPQRNTIAWKDFFPTAASFVTKSPDPFASRLYEPWVARLKNRFERLRWLQQGRLTLYLVYIFVATLGGLAWAVIRSYLR